MYSLYNLQKKRRMADCTDVMSDLYLCYWHAITKINILFSRYMVLRSYIKAIDSAILSI